MEGLTKVSQANLSDSQNRIADGIPTSAPKRRKENQTSKNETDLSSREYSVSLTTQFNNRDFNTSVKAYAEGFQNVTLSINQIIEHIASGYAFVPAAMKGNRANDSFKSTNLVAIDIDAGWGLQEFIDVHGPHILGYYTTGSHQKEKRKGARVVGPPCDRFRAFAALPCMIDDPVVLKLILSAVVNVFKTDRNCTDLCRLFYGNDQAEYAILSPESTLDLVWLFDQFASQHPSLYRSLTRNAGSDLTEKFSKQFESIYPRETFDFRLPPGATPVNPAKKDISRYAEVEDVLGQMKPTIGNRTPFQGYNLDFLKENCHLATIPEATNHEEMIHLIMNLVNIKGTSGFRKELFKNRPCSERRPANYYYELGRDFSNKKYLPTGCAKYCRFFGKHDPQGRPYCSNPKNLLSLQPPRPTSVVRIKDLIPPRNTLEGVRKRLAIELQDAVDRNDGKIHLFIAPAGIGKTQALERLDLPDSFSIAAPTHRVASEIRKDADHYPGLPPAAEELCRESLEWGLGSSLINRLLRNSKDRKLKRRSAQ
ncbi:MAG: hypothetical protein K8S54_10505 [Spirochaetia bacterium]|nr:hypothetical protein [Spirochaetia bacterium]